MHTEAPRLVGGSTDHGAPALPGNNDRFTAQRRVVPLFHRGVKRVHVDMDDFSHDCLATILFSTPGFPGLRYAAVDLGRNASMDDLNLARTQL